MYKLILIIITLLYGGSLKAQAQTTTLSGTALISGKTAAVGVVFRLRQSATTAITNEFGNFSITLKVGQDTLEVFGGTFEPWQLPITANIKLPIVVNLQPLSKAMDEVVVNTGYQAITKERATGSFTTISKSLLNQQSGTSLLSRLESITNGLYVDRSLPGNPRIVIRGMSTILGPRAPLIILNDFPYTGNLDNINPNDVENITVLKDAAAASIWGTQAGNGVIVITTKKGQFSIKTKGTFSSNLLVTDRPDLSDLRVFSPTDNISVERFLFGKGFYNNTINNTPWLALTPVVDILLQQRRGIISAGQADTEIDAIGKHDIRKDFRNYVYQRGINLQQSISLQGGSDNVGWTFSGGWDNNTGVLKNKYERITLRTSQLYRVTKRLQLSTGIDYSLSTTKTGEAGYGTLRTLSGVLPMYTRLADAGGQTLPVIFQYNNAYIDSVSNGRLLDWARYPLNDWQQDATTSKLQAILLDVGMVYKVLPFLSLNIKYQYGRQQITDTHLADMQSYFTRNLINSFTTIDPATNLPAYPIPLGSIIDKGYSLLETHNLRGQANFSFQKNSHSLTGITGAELRQSRNDGYGFRQYGYDPDILTSGAVDYVSRFPNFLDGNPQSISDAGYIQSFLNRFVSFYGNAAYTYKSKYTLSASARRDASNLFGATTNNKWSPLWSVGAAWDVTKENFYRPEWGSELKLRLTYGKSGNADPSRAAVTTLRYSGNSIYTQQPMAMISQFKNPDLSWERVNMFNAGIDYGTASNRVRISLDYYYKKGVNLFGIKRQDYTALPTDNIVTNIASISGHGWDINCNTINLKYPRLQWTSQVNLNFNKDKVLSNELISDQGSLYVGTAGFGVPGHAVASLYAYKWAGLDSLTGNPQGFYNGAVSKDYTSLTGAKTSLNDLEYIGSAQPSFTASVGNTLQWRGFSLSVRVTGKFGYYFLRQSVDYGALFRGASNNADYAMRWQKPGDEKFTNVPSQVYPAVTRRDNFYRYSSVLFSKADHIRLQYITLSYDLKKPSMQVYINMNNLGLLWVANPYKIDPDYNNTLSVSKNIAIGLRLNF